MIPRRKWKQSKTKTNWNIQQQNWTTNMKHKYSKVQTKIEENEHKQNIDTTTFSVDQVISQIIIACTNVLKS